jgi:malonyl-CoA O-methyltransferase
MKVSDVRESLAPLEAYRLWAATWDRDLSAVVALESSVVVRWLGDLRGRLVVDAACGTGRWLSHLRGLGACALGFDFSLPMLARAAAKTELAGTLAAADLRRLPVAARSADLVLCALALGHVAELDLAVRELCRMVKPGGALLVTDFHPDAARRGWKRTFLSGGATFEIENHIYSKEELLALVGQAGLELEALSEPGFGDDQREIFRAAGKEALFEEVRGLPAVLAARWRRPCS